MPTETCAGYVLSQRLPAPSPNVEHWLGEGPDGPADVYIGPEAIVRRARALPMSGPFPRVLTGGRDGRYWAVVPGELVESLESLARRLDPGACLALAWHVASALAEVHEAGSSHGALHPAQVGLDRDGRLQIRPALALPLTADPDSGASAQATDCLHLATIFDRLGVDRLDDPGVALVLAGLRRDRARLRLQPGRSVRQAVSALLSRHPEWEHALVSALDASWVIAQKGRASLPSSPSLPPTASAEVRVAAPRPSPAAINLGGVAAGRSVGGAERAAVAETTDDPPTPVDARAAVALLPDPPAPPAPAPPPEPEPEPEPEAGLPALRSETPPLVLPTRPSLSHEGQIPGAPPSRAPYRMEAEEPAELEPTTGTTIRFADGPAPEPDYDFPAPRTWASRTGPTPAAPVPPPAPPPLVPRPLSSTLEPPPELLEEQRADTPRWSGIQGVTGDERREAELGAGKWAESGRSLEELRREMDASPVRDLETEPSSTNWSLIIGVTGIVLLLLAGWYFFPSEESGPTGEQVGAP